MRHAVAGTKFNVDKDHRKSLLRNLVSSLITHEEIVTTEAKAKAVKVLFDRIVTRAKKNDLQARRIVATYVHGNDVMVKLFDTIVPKLQSRTSGYTTTEMLIGQRAGDSAKQMRVKILLEGEAQAHNHKH